MIRGTASTVVGHCGNHNSATGLEYNQHGVYLTLKRYY